jgi:hypothetical protein
MTFDPTSQALRERYIELFEIGDFKTLHKDQIGRLAFGVPEFWQDRARFLAVDTEAELLKDTPVSGRHSLVGTPAYKRLNGG